jgi:hypothetical protein
MDSENAIIICSLILNVALIIERCFKRVKKSTCLGSNVEFSDNPSPTGSNKNNIKLDTKIDNV